MRFAFYAEGSASYVFTPPDAEGRGVGGAELALIDLTRTLAARGHDVTVFNYCFTPGDYQGVTYKTIDSFRADEEYDVFVLHRTPAAALYSTRAKVKLWFSTDQLTTGNYFTDIIPYVHRGIVISPHHYDWFTRYWKIPGSQLQVIDLGVRLEDYRKPLPKVPGRLLFCSVPHRGLQHLQGLFHGIHWLMPETELYVTSDFSLWGYGHPANNEEYQELFRDEPGVHFLGKVPRAQLVELQQTSDLMVYPNVRVSGLYELFCISAAECLTAGCLPVTSANGALVTTVGPMGGFLIEGEPGEGDYNGRFVAKVLELLSNRKDLEARQEFARRLAVRRFNWDRIANEWELLIQNIQAPTLSSA